VPVSSRQLLLTIQAWDRRLKEITMRTPMASFLALAIAAGTFAASASVPDPGGVIHGCYRKSDGRVRVIDTGKGRKCKNTERSVEWNERGRRGRVGPEGDRGPQGEQGPQGVPGLTSPNVTLFTDTTLVNGVGPTLQVFSWSQPAGTVWNELWVRTTVSTPAGDCDSLSDTGGFGVRYELNGVSVLQQWGSSSPGTFTFPPRGSEHLSEGAFFPGQYEFVARISSGDFDPSCYGTEVTTEVAVQTVQGV
jgi:hypothetical protein